MVEHRIIPASDRVLLFLGMCGDEAPEEIMVEVEYTQHYEPATMVPYGDTQVEAYRAFTHNAIDAVSFDGKDITACLTGEELNWIEERLE